MNAHKVEWTGEKIGNFWNNIDQLIEEDIHVNDYFALMGGKDLIRIVDKYLHFDNKSVMDYGCGIGILTEEIMKRYRPAEVYACDTASESVKQTKERCTNYPNFKDAYVITDSQLPLEDEKFDIIFVTEIVEHLSNEALDFLMRQVHRLLKSGGGVSGNNSKRGKSEKKYCRVSRLRMLLSSDAACTLMV